MASIYDDNDYLNSLLESSNNIDGKVLSPRIPNNYFTKMDMRKIKLQEFVLLLVLKNV